MNRGSLVVAQAAYLFLPLVGSAICSAVVLAGDRWGWLKRPLDFGVTVRGRRLLGDNKTWRGLACAWLGSVAAVALQHGIGSDAGSLAVIDYSAASVVALGTAYGLGATIGELPNSFVKRQLGIAPGGKPTGALVPVLYVWDQVDVLLAIWPLLLWWVRPSPALVVASFGVVFVVHQVISVVGFLIGVRRSPGW